jgi:hypothetical protein
MLKQPFLVLFHEDDPSNRTTTRLIGAVLLEQDDGWQTDCRCIQLKGTAEPATPTAEPEPV